MTQFSMDLDAKEAWARNVYSGWIREIHGAGACSVEAVHSGSRRASGKNANGKYVECECQECKWLYIKAANLLT